MGKFLSPSAGDGRGIVWPPLPWECPRCGVLFASHQTSVATLPIERWEHPEEATFLCIACDFASSMGMKGVVAVLQPESKP